VLALLLGVDGWACCARGISLHLQSTSKRFADLHQRPELKAFLLTISAEHLATRGILRLANALDNNHDGSIQRVRVLKSDGFIVIRAQGLVADSPLAETIAGARHLLEIICGLPFLVQPLPQRRIARKR
jgi:hypothetical protein